MPQGHTPLGVNHFWGPLWGALFSACRKREMLHVSVNKVEIYFAKIGFVDCKLSNLNAPGSYTPWFHSLLGSSLGLPFLCMQEKGNAACGLFIKWKFTFQELVSWTPNVPTRMPQGLAALCFIHFWGPL